MNVSVVERNGVWMGTPKLERIMGIEHGIIVLRSRNKRLLNKLVATAITKNYNPDERIFYVHCAPRFLDAYAEFIIKTSHDLGIDWELLMRTVYFVNFSTLSPIRMEELWTRIVANADNARLLVLDAVGHHPGRDAYLVSQTNRFCYYHNTLALVLDVSEELDPTLERLAAVVVDLDVRGEGIEVFLRKHPKLPQTVFLMTP